MSEGSIGKFMKIIVMRKIKFHVPVVILLSGAHNLKLIKQKIFMEVFSKAEGHFTNRN